MQASQQVSLLTPRSVIPGKAGSVRAFAGVAQLVEHLFCKQVVSGSIPLASSAAVLETLSTSFFAITSSASLTETSEGCPSGQREQAVNLPAHAYVGSNPTPSTILNVARTARGPQPGMRSPRRGLRLSRKSAGVTQSVESQFSKLKVGPRGELSSRPAEVNSAGPHASHDGVLGPRPQNSRRVTFGSAGVTQLVESQFSKLKVDGSSPFSRSKFLGATCTSLDSVSVTSTNKAHLAQLVEHVLGKDEVTSSSLVVGSTEVQP